MWDLPPSRGAGKSLGEITHGILDRKFRITIHPGRATGEGRWFTPRQLRAAPLATSASKCLRLLGMDHPLRSHYHSCTGAGDQVYDSS